MLNGEKVKGFLFFLRTREQYSLSPLQHSTEIASQNNYARQINERHPN
jgi:hypothetical protein